MLQAIKSIQDSPEDEHGGGNAYKEQSTKKETIFFDREMGNKGRKGRIAICMNDCNFFYENQSLVGGR